MKQECNHELMDFEGVGDGLFQSTIPQLAYRD